MNSVGNPHRPCSFALGMRSHLASCSALCTSHKLATTGHNRAPFSLKMGLFDHHGDLQNSVARTQLRYRKSQLCLRRRSNQPMPRKIIRVALLVRAVTSEETLQESPACQDWPGSSTYDTIPATVDLYYVIRCFLGNGPLLFSIARRLTADHRPSPLFKRDTYSARAPSGGGFA